MSFLISNAVFIAFNICNAFIDAYRILKNKSIAHSINFIAYIVCVACCMFFLKIPVSFLFGFMPYGLEFFIFLISAFANRQLSFDIPLNLRRGLPWYYQSEANPPKSLLDRIERRLFGSGAHVGEDIVWFYCCLWCACINVKIWLLW